MIFNEDKLQEEIIKTWGEFGVHNEVFKAMKRQISDLKQLTLTDVVVELPSVKSKEFQRWTQSKGYEPAFNGLWYEKNKVTYETKVLYRAFTNEIEFGN